MRGRLRRFPDELGLFLVLVGICIGLSLSAEYFFTLQNAINVARQMSMITIVAVGMTFVILSGGIDLSVGSLVALTGVITAVTMKALGGNVILGIMAGFLFGGLIGGVNGLIIAKFKVAPFIVTLAAMTSLRGFAFIFSGGRPLGELPQSYFKIGGGYILPKIFNSYIPVPVFIMILIVIWAYTVLRHTKFGRYVYSLGGNEEATRLSGINIERLKISIYSINGFMAAISGIILSSRLFSGDPKAAVGWELDAIAAVVVGGTSLSGGKGTILGTLIGAMLIGVINNGLNMLNVPSYSQWVVKGGVILGAVLLDRLRR